MPTQRPADDDLQVQPQPPPHRAHPEVGVALEHELAWGGRCRDQVEERRRRQPEPLRLSTPRNVARAGVKADLTAGRSSSLMLRSSQEPGSSNSLAIPESLAVLSSAEPDDLSQLF
jgi:hypothetical protein